MPTELSVDPNRTTEATSPFRTGFPLRARFPDGSYGAADVAQLDRASLWSWLRSREGDNRFAESFLLQLLGHAPIQPNEEAPAS